MGFINDLIKKLENRYFALGFSLVVLVAISLLKKEWWGYLFAILLAYLCADLIKLWIITGGQGIVQIPLAGDRRTKHSGHGYLAFMISIIIGAIVGGFVAEYLTTNVIGSQETIQQILLANGLIVILVYLDFKSTFYNR